MLNIRERKCELFQTLTNARQTFVVRTQLDVTTLCTPTHVNASQDMISNMSFMAVNAQVNYQFHQI